MSTKTHNPHLLPVMETFLSIQGEGNHTGKAAFFIRLAGCDVGCHWCDVKESWDANLHSGVAVEELVAEAHSSGAKMVIITGGEPLIYDLGILTKSLQQQGLKTHLETSGAYPLSGDWDWICFSPKKLAIPLKEFFSHSDELKVIVYNQDDFLWAEKFETQMASKILLFLQPEWSKIKEITPFIVEYIKKHPQWKISLQTHKYMSVR